MEYSAQRVRSKTRAAVRKREDNIEQDEMESGELNLIPYLDMVTNLMLFLLASVTAGLILSQINTTLPDRAPPGGKPVTPSTNPDDEPLGLFVSIQRNEMILWSTSKLEGTLKQPKPGYVFTRVAGTQGMACDGPYMCESNVCVEGVCVASKEDPQPIYPYRKLNDALQEIATRRYAGKQRKPNTYTIVLQADGSIPYSVIVSTMAAMRCKLPEFGKVSVSCRLPNEDPDFLKSGEPLSKDGKFFNTEKAGYDPKTMALFHNIQFSTGFE
ncbi:MAG: Biopolymer transport protein ExbD/TolR [Deltaproteobacteria bacterium]|nr:Biopolymer transport protein ExbD/TolR [Deltaproteobacteria bacterium]